MRARSAANSSKVKGRRVQAPAHRAITRPRDKLDGIPLPVGFFSSIWQAVMVLRTGDTYPVHRSEMWLNPHIRFFFFFSARLFSIALVCPPRKPCLRGAAGHGRHTSHLYPGGHRLCEVQLAGRQPASGEGRLTCICKKLTQGRERTVGMAECPCPGNKHSDQAGPETNRHLSRLGSREGAHKGGCLVTPPAPDLDGQDNQAAALRAEQLRVCPLFAAACKGKGGALNTTTPAAGLPRAGQGRYQRGVHGELLPAPQRQAVGNDLKPPVVDTIDLAAHSRGGPLERAPAAPEDTGPSTGCAVVAEGVQRATTPAVALGKWQRKAQAPEKEDAEQVGRIGQGGARGHGGQKAAGEGALLRPEQGLAGWVQGGEQLLTLAAGNS